jgi:hypothetical protein
MIILKRIDYYTEGHTMVHVNPHKIEMKTEAQIAPEDLDEKESVEIECFTLKSW